MDLRRRIDAEQERRRRRREEEKEKEEAGIAAKTWQNIM